jgi:uncharacterized protein YqeY
MADNAVAKNQPISDMSELEADLAAAAKARDQVRLTVLRLLKTALLNYKIEVGEDLTPQQIMSVLQKEAKKHQDSIEQYKNANRDDLVAEESAELEIIDEYLPAKMSADDLEKIVDDSITEAGAITMADMGKVMQIASKKAAGAADGSALSSLVKEKLSK